MEIRMLRKDEQPPWHLLLLADPSKDMVLSYLKDGICYISETTNSQTQGVIVMLPTSQEKLEITNIAVDETMQGKGVGTKLLRHGIKFAKEEGYKNIEIGTGNSSINQLALYQKAGFRIMSIDHDFFTKNYPEPIYENGIQCRDMIRLSMEI
jgi:ribosomal protein S18 acetylase RimI-like enzyme